VEPLSKRRQRFVGLARLDNALIGWIDNALSSTAHKSTRQPERHHSERTGTLNRVFQ